MESSPDPFPWNIVAKNIPIGMTIQTKFHRKIEKLGVHLVHFPPDAVHLQMVVEKNPKKSLYTATVTLRVPSNILHVQKSADNLLTAVDDAVDALFRELEKLKSELRREFLWKQTSHRAQLNAERAGVFSVEPLPSEGNPRAREDMIRDLFRFHYDRMLRYVRREIEFYETTGAIPSGVVDPRELMDETLNQALSLPKEKPKDISLELWFYILLRIGLQRCRDAHAVFRPEDFMPIELEREPSAPDETSPTDGISAETIRNAVEEEISRLGENVDAPTVSSNQEAEKRELLDLLRRESRSWPEQERDVFELFFLEGFDVSEIATMRGAKKMNVEQTVRQIQERLRKTLCRQAALS